MHELQPEDPQLIGPYRLRAGGMGQVFLGLSAGSRPVAVKVVRAHLATDPEFRELFRREIAVARKVSGVYTCPVIDPDVDGPLPWLATAYVQGPSLAEAVTGHGPLPAPFGLALAAGLAEGLRGHRRPARRGDPPLPDGPLMAVHRFRPARQDRRPALGAAVACSAGRLSPLVSRGR